MDRQQALQTIAAEVAAGKLEFTAQVQVALRVREVLDDPDCHTDEVAVLVESDPVLSARVVALASSPALNPRGSAITDARSGLARIGLGTLRTIAVAEVVRHMANMPARPQDRKLAAQLWSHSVHVAALSQVLAKAVTKQNAETAMFAGIVHELGGLYRIFRARDFPCLLDDGPRPPARDAEQNDAGRAEDEAERAVARAIMQKLSIPAPVLQVIEDVWNGYLAMPPVTLGDILLLSEELVTVRSPLRRHLNSARSHNAAYLDACIGPETLGVILNRFTTDVSSLTMALSG